MNADDRQHLGELCAAATPGEWRAGRMDTRSYTGEGDGPFKNVYIANTDAGTPEIAKGWGENCRNDAAFIAAARTALPALLDQLDAAEAEIERLRGIMELCSGPCHAHKEAK